MAKDLRWKKLAVLSGELEADMLVGMLESNGIPAQKVYPGITQSMKIYMGTAVGVEVHVPIDELEIAKKLIEELGTDD